MNGLKDWWAQANPRDQLSVLLLVVAVVLFGFYNFVLSPVAEMRSNQEKSVAAQRARLDRVKTMASQLISQQRGSGSQSDNRGVEEAVQSSFARHGLRVSGFDAGGRSGIRVRFDEVPYENLLTWLHDLELSQGMRMKDVNVSASRQPGRVSATVLIQKEG